MHGDAQDRGRVRRRIGGENSSMSEDMPEWLATLDRYDDPSVEDVW